MSNYACNHVYFDFIIFLCLCLSKMVHWRDKLCCTQLERSQILSKIGNVFFWVSHCLGVMEPILYYTVTKTPITRKFVLFSNIGKWVYYNIALHSIWGIYGLIKKLIKFLHLLNEVWLSQDKCQKSPFYWPSTRN